MQLQLQQSQGIVVDTGCDASAADPRTCLPLQGKALLTRMVLFATGPQPRQYRSDTSTWNTINVHNGGSLLSYPNTNPPNNDVANLNGLIGGAAANQEQTGWRAGDHGLCGDRANRKAFSAGGLYGPTEPRATYNAGGTARVKVSITAYHAGWFEFRLGVPADGGANKSSTVTQTMLNKHVLEIAETTPFHDAVTDYQGMKGYGGWTGHGGEFRCPVTAGYPDVTSTSPQKRWPHGTCCNTGGECSPPGANTDRYVVEYGVNGRSKPGTRNDYQTTYTVDLKIPVGVECVRCVLQMTYITANSADGWPETFWNCADVTVAGDGVVTPAPSPSPPPVTAATTTTTTTTTTTDAPTNNGCSYGICRSTRGYRKLFPLTATTTTTTTTTTNEPADGDCTDPVPAWGKCRGKDWTGSTCCIHGHVCDYQSEWYSQCIPGTDDPNPPPPPTPLPTPTPTPGGGGGDGNGGSDNTVSTAHCVSHAQLVAINAESGYWPACDTSSNPKPDVPGPTNRIYGQYCTSEWADALNVMLNHLDLCSVADSEIRRRFLAQVQWETGYMSTLGQPADDGSGVIHMIPQNWQTNVDDVEVVFPGEGIAEHYASLQTQDAKSAFFRDPQYAYKSAAAWFKRTNGVIPGCGKDLFFAPYDEQTRCIFGSVSVGDRQEPLTLVSKHIGWGSVATATTTTTEEPTSPTSPTPTPTPTPTPPPPNTACNPDGSTGFESTVTADNIHAMFKDWGLSYNGKSGDAAAVEIRSHIACAIAMKPAVFGSFCNSNDPNTNLREAAAFFANIRKETGGFAAMEESASHRYCTSDSASGASDGLQAVGEDYPCGGADASYHGRGAIQLSWNFNYGRFSHFLYNDTTVLLNNPDLIEPSGPTGWASTLWFWMSDQGYGGTAPPQQLDGCVPRGTQSPHNAIVSASVANSHAGMSKTINIINGGFECTVTSPYRSSATARMQSYFDFATMLAVGFHPDCTTLSDCASKNVDLGGGCPLIEANESNACALACTEKSGVDWTGAVRFLCDPTCSSAGSDRPTTFLSSPCA